MQENPMAALPVEPIEYRRQEHASQWWGLVRLVATLALVDAACGIVSHGVGRGNSVVAVIFELLSRRLLLRAWPMGMGLIALLATIADVGLLIAAIGCLVRSESMRRAAVAFCWAKAALSVALSVASLGNFLSYYARMSTGIYWTYLPQMFAGMVSAPLLPVGVALVLASRPARLVFQSEG